MKSLSRTAMSILRYFHDKFTSREARKWWRTYLTGSLVLTRMSRFLVFCFVLQIIFIQKPLIALLAVFTIATLSFVYAIIYAFRKILSFVATELYPNDVLTGYTLIGVGGLLFGGMILIPSYFALATLINAPVSIFSYLITYSYAVPVWAFYLIVRAVKKEETDD